jgi:hypothetical protein
LGNYKKLQVEKEAEITALLTPEEFDEYEMRLSPSANALRAKLGNLNPTAEEFRALVRLRKQFDEQFGDFLAYNPADPSAREKRAQAEHDLNEQMRAVVGVDRWSAYQREQDAGFQGAARTGGECLRDQKHRVA